MGSLPNCPVTGKESYSRREVHAVVKRLGAHGRIVRKFRCGWCEHYHTGRPRGRGGGKA